MSLKNTRKRWVWIRMGLIVLFILGLFAAVLNRMYELQVEDPDKLEEKAQKQVSGKVTYGAGGENHLDGHRGYILDRNGYELAVSVEVSSVYAHPRQIEDKEEAARLLGRALQVDAAEVLAQLERDSAFVWVKRKVSPEKGEKVRALKLLGVGLKRESKRYYPGQDLAGHIIGFAGIDNVGLGGVEAAFDEQLRGGIIELQGLRDARGEMLLTMETPKLNELEGSSVSLTIDHYIQRVTETAIERTARESKAKQAFGLVMDPHTGEILAMAQYPRFNPNRFKDYELKEMALRPVIDVYEPGSVVKPMLYAMALDQGLITPETPLDAEKGAIEIGEYTINDTHRVKDLTAEKMVIESSNIGAYKVAQLLGKEAFYQKLLDFGFGSKTGIGVPGESAGIVWPPKTWAEVTFANIAFGQGLSVSPLQLAVATSALANDGILVKPLLYKEVHNRQGEVVKKWESEQRRRVIGPEAAQQTLLAMEKVVLEGTGKQAWIEGYRVGGKTGTPQKADPRTKSYGNKWMANFIGVAPIDRPDLVIVIMVDEPRTSHLGGVVAAPAFAEIASQVLPYRGVYPR